MKYNREAYYQYYLFKKNYFMKSFFKDPLFDAQLLRTLNHVYHQGADVGECIATAASIKNKDTEG